MPAQKTLGTPQITGSTVEALRVSVQFWMQQAFNHLDQITGIRGTPTFHNTLNLQGNRVRNLPAATQDDEPVARRQAFVLESNPAQGGALQWDAQQTQIFNVSAANHTQDAVNLGQLRTLLDDAVKQVLPVGVILLWSGTVATVPPTFQLCDGTNGTPDLRDRFVVGAGSTYTPGNTGGADTINLAHTHDDGSYATDAQGAHTHDDGSYATGAPSATTTVDNNLAVSTVAVASSGHTHDVTGASGSAGTHTHDVTGLSGSSLSAAQDIRPKYYALAYIMKIA